MHLCVYLEKHLFNIFEWKLFQTNAADSNKCISRLARLSDSIPLFEMIKWDVNVQEHRYEKLSESCCALCTFTNLYIQQQQQQQQQQQTW